jgi:hypothetical protein
MTQLGSFLGGWEVIYGRAGGRMCTYVFDKQPPEQQIVSGVYSKVKGVRTKQITYNG